MVDLIFLLPSGHGVVISLGVAVVTVQFFRMANGKIMRDFARRRDQRLSLRGRDFLRSLACETEIWTPKWLAKKLRLQDIQPQDETARPVKLD